MRSSRPFDHKVESRSVPPVEPCFRAGHGKARLRLLIPTPATRAIGVSCQDPLINAKDDKYIRPTFMTSASTDINSIDDLIMSGIALKENPDLVRSNGPAYHKSSGTKPDL
ncbi:hypothetical protein H4Q26_011226 [Puccinia striiformis f. sp. tritici PST-130]|nr:hypothetical protein H4Q26_011226 [Puccinia striiformis f. sp. tritici PST-130]